MSLVYVDMCIIWGVWIYVWLCECISVYLWKWVTHLESAFWGRRKRMFGRVSCWCWSLCLAECRNGKATFGVVSASECVQFAYPLYVFLCVLHEWLLVRSFTVRGYVPNESWKLLFFNRVYIGYIAHMMCLFCGSHLFYYEVWTFSVNT